jgi:hypothetical protein
VKLLRYGGSEFERTGPPGSAKWLVYLKPGGAVRFGIDGLGERYPIVVAP